MPEMLIEILGKTDGLWLPFRQRHWQKRHAPAAFYEARGTFLSAGLPWRSGGATGAERIAAMRELDALGEAGKVRVTHTPGRTFPFVKLADEADDELRRQCGLADFAESLKLLDELFRRQRGGGPWIPESEIAGVSVHRMWRCT